MESHVCRDGLPDHESGPSTPPPQSAPPWTFSTKYVSDATSLNRPPMHGRGDPPLRAAHAASQLCPPTVLNTHCCPPAEVVGLQADESVEPAADTWPAGQAVHGGLPLGPKKPALHVQAAEVVDPEGLLLEPEGQAVHVPFPAPLNCPAGHVPHLDLSAERPCPAPLAQQSPVVLQPAPVHDDAPATVWPGHAVQVAAPVPLLCLPAAQSVQVAAPVAELCFPGGHLRRKKAAAGEREKKEKEAPSVYITKQ